MEVEGNPPWSHFTSCHLLPLWIIDMWMWGSVWRLPNTPTDRTYTQMNPWLWEPLKVTWLDCTVECRHELLVKRDHMAGQQGLRRDKFMIKSLFAGGWINLEPGLGLTKLSNPIIEHIFKGIIDIPRVKQSEGYKKTIKTSIGEERCIWQKLFLFGCILRCVKIQQL